MTYDKKLIQRDFNRAAKNYNDSAGLQEIVAGKLIDIAGAYFGDIGDIADLGCGTGFIASRAPIGWNIVQLDISHDMCRVAGELSPIVNGDMEQLPFSSDIFDGVISSLALQWCGDERAVFEESYRCLKNGGCLAFSTFGNNTLKELKDVIRDVSGTSHVSEFINIEDIIESLENVGFLDISIKTEEIIIYYDDATALMKKIKGVGGNNKNSDRSKPLTKKILSEINSVYDSRYGIDEGVIATWEIYYIVAHSLY